MKKILFSFALALMFASAFYNCKKTKEEILKPAGKLGDTLTLAYHQEAAIDPTDLKVAFKSLVADSRCPQNVECFWQGAADVEMRFAFGAQEIVDTMHVYGLGFPPDPDSTYAFGYKVYLLDVLPYPADVTPVPQENYAVKVLVK